MAEKNNATCSICGKGYHMCLSCKDAMKAHPWKMHTDTAEHYKVYQIIHGYSTGVYTKSEASSKLQMVDLADLDTFRDNIKDVIKDIMRERKSARVHNRKEFAAEKPKVVENAQKDVCAASDDAQPAL